MYFIKRPTEVVDVSYLEPLGFSYDKIPKFSCEMMVNAKIPTSKFNAKKCDVVLSMAFYPYAEHLSGW